MKKRDDSSVVPLDDETAVWLWRLSKCTRTPAAEIVASMLRLIRLDDQAAHDSHTRH